MSLLYHNDTIMKNEKELTHDVGINQTKPILYTGKILMYYWFLIFFIICLCTSINNRFFNRKAMTIPSFSKIINPNFRMRRIFSSGISSICYIVLRIVFPLKLHYFFTIFHYFIVFATLLFLQGIFPLILYLLYLMVLFAPKW